jgi:hypothetical protein
MTRAVNYRELKRLYETMGSKEVCRHLRDSLANDHLRPEDFSLRDLAEATIPDGREFVRLLDPRSKAGGIDLMEAADAVDTATFSNITGQIVFSKIMEGFSSDAFVASRMVENVPTRFSGEKIPGIGQMGDAAESIDEGKPYPNVGVTEDYIETPATTKRGMIVPVTKEAIFFDRTHLVLQRAGEVGEFLGLNKEKRLLDCLIDANVTDHRYKWRGAIYATYQTSAPWINVKSSNPLVDWTDVDAAEQLLANITDPNTGEPVLIMADTILVCPESLHAARRIVDATQIEQVDNQANAKTVRTFAPNPMAGSYRVVSSRLLRSRLSAAGQATSNWYLGNFRKAFAYMENWPITVTQAPQNSEAEFTQDIMVRFKASERGAAATLEPRFVVKNTA